MTLNTKINPDGTPKEFHGERARMEAFSDKLFESSYEDLCALSCVGYVTKEPVSFADRLTGKAVPLCVGEKWAEETFDCAWFHITGTLPEEYDAKDLVFRLNCGGEGLIYDNAGNPVQGITCYASEFSRDLGEPVKEIIPVYDELHSGRLVDFWIDCGANDLFGDMKNQSRVGALSVALANGGLRSLAYDVHVLLNVLDFGEVPDFQEQIRSAVLQIMEKPAFTEEWAESCAEVLAPLMNRHNEGENVFTFSGIGHSHLDLAWLWPLRETKRKGARTFATQLKNIERYPEYVYGSSQPQLYQWIKDGYPQLYSRVKEAAKSPNWDVQGATWVEMDSNLISGESMVRQFYYGKKFHQKEFGQDVNIFWVPDSFGYSGCLPQVMKLAEVPYFLTMKMSWSLYNKFPYHTFHWKGIDGSTVFAHMLPEDTYNAPVRPDSLIRGEKNYRERKISDISLSVFGIGDGGAGPGYEHIERARRVKDLYGVPRFRFEKSKDFFARLDKKDIPYPTYEGELYLERHQGTYTTQAANKKYNRLCEFLLKNYEMLYCMANEQGIETPISMEQLEALWKEILLYQFHDILPGSSINRVYEESVARYEIISNQLKNGIDLLTAKLFRGNGYFNFNAYPYEKPIKKNRDWYLCEIAPLGFADSSKFARITEFKATCSADTIENDCVRVTFDKGYIKELFSKQLNRQFVSDGKPMGVVSQYTDNGDCWDMQGTKADYLATRQDAVCVAFHTFTDGPKAAAECTYKIGDCTVDQTFWILDGDPAVYCRMDLDVHQQAKMLRISFPTCLQTEKAAFNVQFGHLYRSTTENNSVEIAQFEVSGQKFVDLSEESAGLSLINDSKYGFRVKHGVIDMNLVRTPRGGPGQNVDQGHHTVSYVLFPHAGALGTDTYRRAYELNNPPVEVRSVECGAENTAFYHSSNDAVILETIKNPEDGCGLITRFYNTSEKEQTAQIQLDGYRPVEVVNILENKLQEKTDGQLTLRGFELINIRWIKA